MSMSSVRGVAEGHDNFLCWFDKPEERDGFLRFFELVQRRASELGCVFFVDDLAYCSDLLPDMYLADLNGWLVPNEEADEFEKLWRELETRSICLIERWRKYHLVEKYEFQDGGTVKVDFIGYDDYVSSIPSDCLAYLR